MSSTFFGLNIGASGLRTYQTAINTTANNVANVQTDGYTKQTTTREASSALRVTAKYGSVGTGVEATAITQDRNEYYDVKYRENSSASGLYESKLYYMQQIETIFTDDDTQNGFSTLFSKMFNGLDTLKTNAADKTVRNQFINQTQNLCTYFNSLNTSLNDIQKDCNDEIKNTVENINSIAKKISLMNKEINRLELSSGGTANELRDERNNLLDELSSLVEIETKEYYVKNSNGDELGGTNFSVYINGQTLVDGNDYRTLDCQARTYLNNQTDIDGLYDVYWSDTGTTFDCLAGTADGYLKGLFSMRDGNNAENLTGTVSSESDPTKIVMTDCTYAGTRAYVAALNLPSEGAITINNKKYYYDKWEATTDDDGNITKIAFSLKPESQMTAVDFVKLADQNIVCSETVDSMGVVYYQEQINEFLRTFATMLNDIQVSGQDLNGDPMAGNPDNGDTFTNYLVAVEGNSDKYSFSDSYQYVTDEDGTKHYTRTGVNKITSTSDTYDKLTAGNVGVSFRSLKNPAYLSTTVDTTNGTDAYDLVSKMLEIQDQENVFRGAGAGDFLETMLSDISVDTQKADTFHTNYNNLCSSVDTMRMSVSGVDEDEEALDLVKFQNAYNMNSKVISVMSEIYDKLINETGVT